MKNESTKEVLCCPRCRHQFSDWFTWNGDRYCYPCKFGHPYNNSTRPHNLSLKLITESEGVWLQKSLK